MFKFIIFREDAMSFICNRCKEESSNRSETKSICVSCEEDLKLLDKQLEINNRRIKKLEEHKKDTVLELENLDSEDKHETLLETMKRIERNLRIEYEQHEGIIKAIKIKERF